MADSAVAVTAGSGTNIDTRTESTNGNHRAVIVLGDPSDNSGIAPVDSTAGLKVDLGADNDITGTVTANLGATDNAVLDSIDSAVNGTLTVDLGANNDVTVTSGTVDLGATDNAVLDSIDSAVNGTLDVSGTVDLGATDNAVLDAIQTATEATQTATEAIQAGQLADGHNVTVDNASLTVDLGANNDVTVTGTVDLGATDNAVLDSIDTAVNGTVTVDATGSGDVPVTLDSEAVVLGAGTAAIGKLAANSGVDIGDVDVTSLPSVTIGTNTDSIDGPGTPTIDSYTTDDVNLAADTANQSVIAAPGASKQIWVYGLAGTADVAGSISIQDEDDTALSGIMPVGATGGIVMNPSGNFAMPWIKVATNKALEIDTVTCTFDGTITYAIVSV